MHRLPCLLGDLQNVWTSQGMEYAWFNVETKPGIGYPKDAEPEALNGGWVRKRNGGIQPRIGSKWRILANIFANPDLPEIDDYYEPFTSTTSTCRRRPSSGLPHGAAALADHRPAHGGRSSGARTEEILGGEFAKRSADYN